MLAIFYGAFIATEGDEYIPTVIKSFPKYIKTTVVIVFVGVLGLIFIPTKNEVLLIYGVGGTIDYLKENETASQIPDKCINALDKWVESLVDTKE